MSKQSKVKVEYVYEYWLVYFQGNDNGQPINIRLKRSSWRTIGHALANWILKDETEAKRYKQLEELGNQLNDVRSYALSKMRGNGIKVCLKGKTRIEEISIDEKDITENNRRAIRLGHQDILATEKKCYDLTRQLRSDFGWLFETNIKKVKKTLLLGNTGADIPAK